MVVGYHLSPSCSVHFSSTSRLACCNAGMLYGDHINTSTSSQNGLDIAVGFCCCCCCCVPNNFLGRKWLYFDLNFTEICSQGSNWQPVSTGSGNGLVPSSRQAINWTNVSIVYRRVYASLGFDELTHSGQDKMANIILHNAICIFSRETCELRKTCSWNEFPSVQLQIIQHWFKYWLVVQVLTSRYPNRWWPRYLTPYGVDSTVASLS